MTELPQPAPTPRTPDVIMRGLCTVHRRSRQMKIRLITALCALALALPLQAAERYLIDTGGMHAFVQFRISHLGYSWLYGRFNDFEGEFTFAPDQPENSAVQATIRTASVDSNHARRDRHLRSDDFLDVENHPEARF